MTNTIRKPQDLLGEGPRTMKQWQDVRRKHPRHYNSPTVQNQILQDRKVLGEAFYSNAPVSTVSTTRLTAEPNNTSEGTSDE